MRDKDNALKKSMDSRDNNCMNNLGHCKQSFYLMSYEIKNNRTLLESLAMRQRGTYEEQCQDHRLGDEDSVQQEEDTPAINLNLIL